MKARLAIIGLRILEAVIVIGIIAGLITLCGCETRADAEERRIKQRNKTDRFEDRLRKATEVCNKSKGKLMYEVSFTDTFSGKDTPYYHSFRCIPEGTQVRIVEEK